MVNSVQGLDSKVQGLDSKVKGLDSNIEYKMLVVTEEDTIKAQEILREIGFNRRPHNLTSEMMNNLTSDMMNNLTSDMMNNLTSDMMKKDYGDSCVSDSCVSDSCVSDSCVSDSYVIGSLYFSDSCWVSCSSKTSNDYYELDECEEITYEELLEIYNTFKEDKRRIKG